VGVTHAIHKSHPETCTSVGSSKGLRNEDIKDCVKRSAKKNRVSQNQQERSCTGRTLENINFNRILFLFYFDRRKFLFYRSVRFRMRHIFVVWLFISTLGNLLPHGCSDVLCTIHVFILPCNWDGSKYKWPIVFNFGILRSLDGL